MTGDVELVVDAGGDVRCIYDEGIDLRELGTLKITRASHVEPDSDGNWWADMGPSDGPVLGPFRSRSEALVAEREWLSAQEPFAGATTGPLYSITTWDYTEQAFTPQKGLSVPSLNVSWRGLLAAVRELKAMGYSCHRVRASDGSHDDNDSAVMIERVDGGAAGDWRGPANTLSSPAAQYPQILAKYAPPPLTTGWGDSRFSQSYHSKSNSPDDAHIVLP